MKIIARIRSDFPTKFGIPRQSGRVEELTACIVFEPEYRVREAVKGLEDFSHIWLLWEFSQSIRENWSPTVRPPRLGGNERMGVFATRSPFRPNPSMISSHICLWQTVIRKHWAALRRRWSSIFCRWKSRKNGRQGSRRISFLHWKVCSEKIRGLPTRRIRRGYTECLLQGWMFVFR